MYAPIYAGAENVSTAYTTGTRSEYDPDAAYWTFDFVTNWAMLRYEAMIEDIRAEQAGLEEESAALIEKTDAEAAARIAAGDEADARRLLTDVTVQRGDEIIDEWQNLAATLVVKYSNGLITDPATGEVDEPGYPAWWYQEADYQYGPRVYDLERLRATPGLNYTGESIWVPKNASVDEVLDLI